MKGLGHNHYKGHGVTLHKGQLMMRNHDKMIVRIHGFSNCHMEETETMPHILTYRDVAENEFYSEPISRVDGRFRLFRTNDLMKLADMDL